MTDFTELNLSNQNIEKYKDNVDIIHLYDKDIYLIGTAHISQNSVDLAESTIREIMPDTVAIELCEKRYESLKDPDRWKKTDIIKVIKEGKFYVLIAQLMLASFQKKLGDKLKVKPGTEMMTAARVADELHIPIALVDREIKITLKRVWGNLGFFTMLKTFFSILFGIAKDQEIESEDIEKLKSQDALESALSDFSKEFPQVKTSLIDERDLYLAEKLRTCPGKKVVAIIGAGHTPGIKKHIFKKTNLAPLETLPPPSKFVKFLKYGIPAIVVLMIVIGFCKADFSNATEMLKSWFFIKSISAAIGASLALAHPITILASAILAPFTALNPTVSVGIFAGLIEAWIKKPTIEDFETVSDDLTTLKGWWKNRLSKILLVAALTNLLGSIGTFWAGSAVFKHFINMF